VKARAATPDTTSARAAAEASVEIHGGPPVRASALALALVVALALGGSLDAAEMVAATVEPAVAVTATGELADALAEPDAEADASPPDAWARAGDAVSTTVKVTVTSHNESFLLDSTCHSSLSSSAPNTIPSIAGIRYMAQSIHAVYQSCMIANS
jgi:hypothetical protein